MLKLGFVVEGTNDAYLLERLYPNVMVVTTRGTRFDNRVRNLIDEMLNEVDLAFLLFDPDEPGINFGKLILEEYLLPQIHLDPVKCMCYRNHKWKCGVEHANEDYLKKIIDIAIEIELEKLEQKGPPL